MAVPRTPFSLGLLLAADGGEVAAVRAPDQPQCPEQGSPSGPPVRSSSGSVGLVPLEEWTSGSPQAQLPAFLRRCVAEH